MKTGTKIVLGAAGAGLLGFIIYKIVKKRKENVEVSAKSSGSKPKPRFPLQEGSGMGSKAYQQADVKIVQQALNKKAVAPLARIEEDGKWGAGTSKMMDAVFQVKSVNEEFFNKLKQIAQGGIINY
jgi:hypothetical protein